MKIQSRGRLTSVTGIALAGTLALSACGSDNNVTPTPGASNGTTNAADCPKGTLSAEGSSAQKNAIEQAITDFQDACKTATLNYNPTGSGAGIKQFIGGQVDFAGSDSALKDVAKAGSTSIEQADADKTCGSPAWNLPMVTGPIAVGFNVKGVDKCAVEGNEAVQAEVQAAQIELAGVGRVLLRKSGTEPLVRVMVEADDAARAHVVAQRLADVVARNLAL